MAAQHTGWHYTDAIGKPLLEVFSFVDEKSHSSIDILEHQNMLSPEISKHGIEGLLLPKQGEPVPVEANITTIKDGKGKAYGMVLVFRDVTQQREAIREIRRQASRAEALLQVASQLNSHLELETVLNTICGITNRTIKATGTTVVLQYLRKDIFRVMAAIGHDPVLKALQEPLFEVPKAVFQRIFVS